MSHDLPYLSARRYEAVALVMAGKSLKQIAVKLGVSPERIRQMIVRQAGTDFTSQIAMELWMKGRRRKPSFMERLMEHKL